MQATVPWPVSPEFQDALVLATQRHQSQPPQSSPVSSLSTSHSASIMMKTRVAVRDNTSHRFQVVPLREAPKNRENLTPMFRPLGVGLGLNVPINLASSPAFERVRQSTPQHTGLPEKSDTPKRSDKVALRGLQTRSRDTPNRKENKDPNAQTSSPAKRVHRPRDYPSSESMQLSTLTPSHRKPQLGEDTVVINPLDFDEDRTIILDSESVHAHAPSLDTPVNRLRHAKSPSLGTIHHLLSHSTSSSDENLKPRVKCRKRTNTLSVAHASNKRYGVYTPDKLDFSPVDPPSVIDRPLSTYSFGALLSAYSCDSLSSVYSQESLMEFSTRPLRVKARPLRMEGPSDKQPHPIVSQLLHDVEMAFGDWLEDVHHITI